ncbi:hypothetical protein ACNKHU_13105 [Shigella flexneri]
MANYGLLHHFRCLVGEQRKKNRYEMAMFSRNRGESGLQPALADDSFGNHPLTPERGRVCTDLLKKMTVDEKIGQLRLIRSAA